MWLCLRVHTHIYRNMGVLVWMLSVEDGVCGCVCGYTHTYIYRNIGVLMCDCAIVRACVCGWVCVSVCVRANGGGVGGVGGVSKGDGYGGGGCARILPSCCRVRRTPRARARAPHAARGHGVKFGLGLGLRFGLVVGLGLG